MAILYSIFNHQLLIDSFWKLVTVLTDTTFTQTSLTYKRKSHFLFMVDLLIPL